MIKINQHSLVKSRTEDNFPYLEVFSESSKQTIKMPVKAIKFIANLRDPKASKKEVLLQQRAKIIYGERQIYRNTQDFDKVILQEDLDIIREYQRLGTYIFSKTYLCKVTVPSHLDLSDVQSALDRHTKACLFNITSNHPISINKEKDTNLSQEEILSQLLYYKHDEDDHRKWDLILDKYNKPQYRITDLSLEEKLDIDLRTSLPKDFTAPPECFSALVEKNRSRARY